MSKETDILEAEAALALVIARYGYSFWDNDRRCLKEALEILRRMES